MKLSYFELLSPEPIYIEHVGGILSPTLRVISQTGIMTYQYYVSVLLMEEEIFETLPQNPELAQLLQLALDFFIKENVDYSTTDNCFVVHADDKVVGVISKDNYATVCDLICQRISMKPKQDDDISKAKNKKAMEIMEKLQKGRTSKAKQTKTDKNLEIGNVISAVANRSQSLNILNIWDLTVFQLWDCFERISNNNIYNIQSMSVAAYGNKDNHFDFSSWFKKLSEDN